MNYKQNKKFVDPRYFLKEQIGLGNFLKDILGIQEPGDPNDQLGEFVQGTPAPPPSNPNEVIARARSVIGKGWKYTLEGCPACKGNAQDPKPDPKQVYFGASNATCDCSGFVAWSLGFWQKQWGANGLSKALGTPVSNPMPGDVVARGPMINPKTNYPHFGIVSEITNGASDMDVHEGKADFTVIHCSSRNGPVEMQNAMKGGWAGNPPVPVMFYRPNLQGADLATSAPSQKTEQPPQPGVKPTNTARMAPANESLQKENKMRHNLWDRMMHRLLQEKKEKEVKASKSKGAKPDFLDLDKDGDKEEPMSKASKEAGGKKDAPKAKKGKGKIPPQLKMHIQKKKKSKLDESIERLERILINEATVSDFKKFPINIVHERGKEAYQDSIVATVSFEFPGTPVRTSDFGPDQAPNPEKVPVLKRFMDKKRSGEFKPKYDTRESDSYQYWLEEMLALPKNIHPEAEIYFDDGGARGSCEIVFDTEDKASFMEFASKLSEMAEELDELGGYDVLVYSGKLKHRNGQNFVPYQGKRYGIKDNLLQKLDKDLPDDEEVGISAPGAVAGGQVAESIRRLKRLLREYKALEEYGEDKYPSMEEEDEGFEDDSDFDDEDFEDVESDEDFEDDEEDFDYDFEDEEDVDDMGDEGEEEYLTEAEVKKKKPRLGKVTRNPSGSNKKFHVYVKCGGKVKKISFGDPGLSIKRDSAARRKNFRARHKCDKPAGKDRCTARYWSCYQWRAGKKVEGE